MERGAQYPGTNVQHGLGIIAQLALTVVVSINELLGSLVIYRPSICEINFQTELWQQLIRIKLMLSAQ